jgi:hypothetical protein
VGPSKDGQDTVNLLGSTDVDAFDFGARHRRSKNCGIDNIGQMLIGYKTPLTADESIILETLLAPAN